MGLQSQTVQASLDVKVQAAEGICMTLEQAQIHMTICSTEDICKHQVCALFAWHLKIHSHFFERCHRN
jgi:hypothetical protein